MLFAASGSWNLRFAWYLCSISGLQVSIYLLCMLFAALGSWNLHFAYSIICSISQFQIYFLKGICTMSRLHVWILYNICTILGQQAGILAGACNMCEMKPCLCFCCCCCCCCWCWCCCCCCCGCRFLVVVCWSLVVAEAHGSCWLWNL